MTSRRLPLPAMRRVSVSSSSQISAYAGASVADHRGNAVDAAVAAAMVSLCTEPGLVGPGGGGFVSIWPPGGDPVVIDGYAEMPGRGLPRERFGGGGREVYMEYGGGMSTIVGYGSVATPGVIAGLSTAVDKYGAAPWATVLEPAIEWAAKGFPLPAASAEYFAYASDLIFGWHPASRRVLHHEDGTRLATGERVFVPALADSLQLIADEGADVFYTGELGAAMAAEIEGNGGLLTAADLAAYRAVERAPIVIGLDGWDVAVNPPPAIGGATVAAILLLLESGRFEGWGPDEVDRMIDAQWGVLGYRKRRLGGAHDIAAEVATLLDLARVGDHHKLLASPSTIHVSAVDSEGRGCSITASAGYGSGVMVAGTGLWLNNSLGEIELHPEGYHALQPGTRLPSNMAPTVARRPDGSMLAIGSPGADRITSAIAQVLVNFMHLGLSLTEAVQHARLHVEVFDGKPTVAYEPGLAVRGRDGLTTRPFPDLSMYFGGVQAALWDPVAGLFGAADPRRKGGVARGGG